MLVTILICDFLFDGDPEFILFMLYILYSLLSTYLTSAAIPPAFAPHVVEVIQAAAAAAAAAAERNSNELTCAAAATATTALQNGTTTTTCTAAAAAATATTATATTTFIHKYCGKTIGETAATCGITVAYNTYFNPRRYAPLKKYFLHLYFHTIGFIDNVAMDIVDWVLEMRNRAEVA